MAKTVDDLEDELVRIVLTLLEELRVEVVGRLLRSKDGWRNQYARFLREIDDLVAEYTEQLVGQYVASISVAADFGAEVMVSTLAAQAPSLTSSPSFVGVSRALVRASSDYTASLVTMITDEARAAITRAIRRGVLGTATGEDVVREIGTSLKDGALGKAARDAETIARTEILRVFNTAHYEQGRDAHQRFNGGMTKAWGHASASPGFSAFQGRSNRRNHVQLSDRTRDDPIPYDDLFEVAPGVFGLYPHDPNLPAGEVVNCRCRLIVNAPPVEQ